MKSIALLSLLAALFVLSSGQSKSSPNSPGFLLGTWDFVPSPDNDRGAFMCSPFGQVTIEANEWNSSSVYLVATQWKGLGCEAYNLSGYHRVELGFSPNATQAQLRKVASYNSQQLYTGIIAYNMSVVNVAAYMNWFFYLQGNLVNPNSTYNININSTNFDLSAFAVDGGMIFNSTDALYGTLSFSLYQNGVKACTNNTADRIWGTYLDNSNKCYHVATQNPTYALLNTNDSNEGISITFPVVAASNASDRAFQLIINLKCDLNAVNKKHTAFTMSLLANSSANLETMTLNGSSIYGCPTTMYQNDTKNVPNNADKEKCGPIILGSDKIYNLCPFNQSALFNVSDILGGSLSFSLTTAPSAECISGDSVWGVYNDNSNNCYEVATQNPVFSLLNETNSEQGLQITFPVSTSQAVNVRSFQLVVNLVCDIDYVEHSQTPFTMDLFVVGDIEVITVTGTTIYGCPASSNGNIKIVEK